jgi:23S rRNA (cytosine1962-C5)-methyltransferase
LAKWCLTKLGVKSVYVKHFVPDRTSEVASRAMYVSTPLVGEPCEEIVVGRERCANFAIRPYDGFSTGIFLDQRDNRRWISETAEGKKVLNCFAYTAAFSVACALRGAQTVSVDVSAKSLRWAKENFSLNSLALEGHRWILGDAREFLRRARKRGEIFDRVILDPPSFSRNKQGGVFSVAKEGGELITAALEILASGGRLFFSTNYAGWGAQDFEAMVTKTLKGTRGIERLKIPPCPQDFSSGDPPLHAVSLEKVD